MAVASISKSNGWIGELADPCEDGMLSREGWGLHSGKNGGESSGSGRLDDQLNTGSFEKNSCTIHSKFQHLDWGAGTSMRRWAAAERRMEIKVSENGGGSGAAWMAD